jgi:DNA-binding winged helix-turn-helix (wHTH) protein
MLISPTGEPMPLPSRAFATLIYLVEHSGQIVDKAAIMSTVWPKPVDRRQRLPEVYRHFHRRIVRQEGTNGAFAIPATCASFHLARHSTAFSPGTASSI